MYSFSIAIVTNCHKFHGLKQQIYGIGYKKSKINLTWLKSRCHRTDFLLEVLGENLFLHLQSQRGASSSLSL